ncbi:hypothetical protein OG21DRAFT_1517815 [Imleria badia]|nr:hypothetical protein OG21DRAFT_1517815 [Imleria badia]
MISCSAATRLDWPFGYCSSKSALNRSPRRAISRNARGPPELQDRQVKETLARKRRRYRCPTRTLHGYGWTTTHEWMVCRAKYAM